MHDAHFHMTDELFASMKMHRMMGIANAENKEEYARLQIQQREYSFSVSVGVHPWHASMEALTAMEPLLFDPAVGLIGEIGLDNVWCETDMDVQREVFTRQLAIASKLKKPAILHTKGMEAEIASMISKYPNRYLVHWYSCTSHLLDYLDLDCYFTVGPSVGLDASVTRVALEAPLERLLLETDGISAVKWVAEAYPEALSIADAKKKCLHAQTLDRSLHVIAKLRGLDPKDLEARLDTNFKQFLSPFK